MIKSGKLSNYLEEELVSGDLFYELARISSIEFHPKVQGDRGDTYRRESTCYRRHAFLCKTVDI
jgi:hypothetical protein